MRRVALAAVVALTAVPLCGGCAWHRTPVAPPQGLLFTNYCAPLTTEFESTPAEGKTGTASTLYFHDWLITGIGLAWDDASVHAAAREGGLSRVHYADYEALQVLGFFGKFTTRAYGE